MTKNLPPATLKLLRDITRYVKPYYAINDKAHNLKHAAEVAMLGLELNERFELGENPAMIIVAAYMHDTFSSADRDNHHTLASEEVIKCKWPGSEQFTQEEVFKIAAACAEHRASFKGEFYSMLSEIISAADRGRPDLLDWFKRAYIYGIDKLGITDKKEAMVRAVGRIQEVYGEDGYANIPRLWSMAYSDEFTAIRKILADTDKCVGMLETYLAE